MTAGVYLLRDPRDGVVRYVGESDWLEHRKKQYTTRYHPKVSAHNRKRGGLTEWLKELTSVSMRPLFEIADVIDDFQQRRARERELILQHEATVLNLRLYSQEALQRRREAASLVTCPCCGSQVKPDQIDKAWMA